MLGLAALVVLILIDAIGILIFNRLNQTWALASVLLNLLLANIFGSVVVHVLDLDLVLGNVFYGLVFFATQCLLECRLQDRTIRQQVVWFVTIFVVILVGLSQLAIVVSEILSSPASESALFIGMLKAPLRITLASALAYVFAQQLHITVYQFLKTKYQDGWLWMRGALANSLSQAVDTLIFFSVAYINISAHELLHFVLAGWLVKTAVVAMCLPLLMGTQYLDKHLKV
jgi:uncharacterized integral membrane protein (TIGR00697 family)